MTKLWAETALLPLPCLALHCLERRNKLSRMFLGQAVGGSQPSGPLAFWPFSV